jgi:hypothetical protein
MNSYEKYQKDYLKNYFHTEEGREHMKQAQYKYFKSEKGRQVNNINRMKSYYKLKSFKDETKRMALIQIG